MNKYVLCYHTFFSLYKQMLNIAVVLKVQMLFCVVCLAVNEWNVGVYVDKLVKFSISDQTKY